MVEKYYVLKNHAGTYVSFSKSGSCYYFDFNFSSVFDNATKITKKQEAINTAKIYGFIAYEVTVTTEMERI